jgi:hypothetical protein
MENSPTNYKFLVALHNVTPSHINKGEIQSSTNVHSLIAVLNSFEWHLYWWSVGTLPSD